MAGRELRRDSYQLCGVCEEDVQMNDSAGIKEHVEALCRQLDPKRVTALANLLREPKLTERMSEFIRAGWVTQEVEFLDAEWRSGEVLARFDSWEVVTNQRAIDRADLRARYRPESWTRLDTWEAQFPRINNQIIGRISG
jgi:hypothetical protein